MSEEDEWYESFNKSENYLNLTPEEIQELYDVDEDGRILKRLEKEKSKMRTMKDSYEVWLKKIQWSHGSDYLKEKESRRKRKAILRYAKKSNL
jgi:hypothetical protein